MKLIINYDLVNEIFKANTGFNLKRFNYKIGIYLGTLTALNIPNLILSQHIQPTILPCNLLTAIFIFGGSELALKSFTEQEANFRLNSLASSLSKINIYTNTEAIKKAHLYKTQYKIVRGAKPVIQQNKFITLPTSGSFNADEVSLQQEHTIGSKEYVLSIGEPKKAHNKVTSNVFARQI